MTFSLIAERRRHAPRGAAGGEPGAPRARPDRRRDRSPGKATGTLRAGQRLRIETPGGGGFGDGDGDGSPASERIGFLGLGIMGSRMAANVARAGYPADACGPTPRARPSAGPAEHGAVAARDARRGGGAQRHRGEHGRRRSPGRGACCAATDGVVEARPRGTAVRRHVDDRARRHAPRSARALRERGMRMLDAPVTGSSPRAAGRHADDHGRAASRRTSSARGRCWRRWAS